MSTLEEAKLKSEGHLSDIPSNVATQIESALNNQAYGDDFLTSNKLSGSVDLQQEENIHANGISTENFILGDSYNVISSSINENDDTHNYSANEASEDLIKASLNADSNCINNDNDHENSRTNSVNESLLVESSFQSNIVNVLDITLDNDSKFENFETTASDMNSLLSDIDTSIVSNTPINDDATSLLLDKSKEQIEDQPVEKPGDIEQEGVSDSTKFSVSDNTTSVESSIQFNSTSLSDELNVQPIHNEVAETVHQSSVLTDVSNVSSINSHDELLIAQKSENLQTSNIQKAAMENYIPVDALNETLLHGASLNIFESKLSDLQNNEISSTTGEEAADVFSHNLDCEKEIPAGDVTISHDSVLEESSELISSKSEPNEPETVIEENKTEDWLNILGNNSLRKKVIRKGKDESRPAPGQRVTISFTGRLSNDQIVDESDSFSFITGEHDVIQALEICVSLMDLHEIALIDTDARFAYGSIGRRPNIPGDARIMYTVELLSIEDVPPFSNMTVAEILKYGEVKKERGNYFYSRNEFSSAINVYEKALRIVQETGSSLSAEEVNQIRDARTKYANNLAAAQLKLQMWDQALESCDLALKLQPTNVKALFRKAKCLTEKGEVALAVSVLKFAQKCDPADKGIAEELTKLSKRLAKETDSEKALYQKMLGTKKETKQNVSKGYRHWWYIGGAAAAALLAFGLVSFRYAH